MTVGFAGMTVGVLSELGWAGLKDGVGFLGCIAAVRRSPVPPHPRFKSGAGSDPLPRRGEGIPLPCPAGLFRQRPRMGNMNSGVAR